MLGKLLKHEFRATALPMLIIAAVLAVMPIGEGILIALSDIETDVGLIFFVLSLINLFTQLLVLSAAMTVGYVFVAIRFYTHIYGSQGYLTLMLPAKRSSILLSKMLTSAAWLILHTVIGYVGVFVPIMFIDFGGLTIYDAIGMAFSEYEGFIAGYFVIVAVVYLISLANMIATLYFSVSLGQLFRKNRIFAAVLIFFGIYSVQYTIYMIISFFTSFVFTMTASETYMLSANFSTDMSYVTMGLTALVSLIFFIVQYLLTNHILKKRVNLQ